MPQQHPFDINNVSDLTGRKSDSVELETNEPNKQDSSFDMFVPRGQSSSLQPVFELSLHNSRSLSSVHVTENYFEIIDNKVFLDSTDSLFEDTDVDSEISDSFSGTFCVFILMY